MPAGASNSIATAYGNFPVKMRVDPSTNFFPNGGGFHLTPTYGGATVSVNSFSGDNRTSVYGFFIGMTLQTSVGTAPIPAMLYVTGNAVLFFDSEL